MGLSRHEAFYVDRRGIQGIGKETRRKETNLKTMHWSKDYIKLDFQEVGCEGMDCIDLDKDTDRWRALLNAVVILQFP